MVKKIFIFDRDNTLVKDKGYTYKIHDLKFLPHTIKALKYLKKNNFLVTVATNQSGVARGFFKISDVKKFHKAMNKILSKNSAKIDSFFFCPHHIDGKIKRFKKKCKCRKPNPLLLLRILKKFSVKKNNCIMIGDKNTDKLAAHKLGIKFFLKSKNLFKQVKKLSKII